MSTPHIWPILLALSAAGKKVLLYLRKRTSEGSIVELEIFFLLLETECLIL